MNADGEGEYVFRHLYRRDTCSTVASCIWIWSWALVPIIPCLLKCTFGQCCKTYTKCEMPLGCFWCTSCFLSDVVSKTRTRYNYSTELFTIPSTPHSNFTYNELYPVDSHVRSILTQISYRYGCNELDLHQFGSCQCLPNFWFYISKNLTDAIRHRIPPNTTLYQWITAKDSTITDEDDLKAIYIDLLLSCTTQQLVLCSLDMAIQQYLAEQDANAKHKQRAKNVARELIVESNHHQHNDNNNNNNHDRQPPPVYGA